MCVYVCKAHVRFLRVCGRQAVSVGEVNERVRRLHVAALFVQTRYQTVAVAQGMPPLEDVPEGSAFAIDFNRDIFVMVRRLDAFIRRRTQTCCGTIGTDHIIGRCACAIRSISPTLSAADIVWFPNT